VDGALEELGAAALKASEGGQTIEIEGRKQALEKYRSKVGLIAVIDLVFLFEETFHVYQKSSEWFDDFEGLRPEEDGDEEESSTVEQEADKAVVDRWADTLANDPQFGKCKSYDEREYLLEKLAKDEFGTLPAPRIIRRADTVYELDVRAKQDERLRHEARRLHDEGKNINAIALKLGISRDRVSGLLAE